jgi:hypothetical protein
MATRTKPVPKARHTRCSVKLSRLHPGEAATCSDYGIYARQRETGVLVTSPLWCWNCFSRTIR